MLHVTRPALGVFVTSAVLLLGGSSVAAQQIERVPARPLVSVEGKDSYREYCAVCHGVSAKGDGPAASALRVPPPDLTTIAKRHDGKFPAAGVEQVITGVRPVTAHGTRDMPIWGPVFSKLDSDPDVMKLRVVNLVEHLRSLQAQ